MILNIGTLSHRIAKGMVTVEFKGFQKILVVNAEKTKFIYLNLDEVMSITISE